MANTLVYKPQGGDELVVASGGEINVESGGKITDDGTQASAISDLAITYSSNDPTITANGAVTVADGSAASVAELLELCEELMAQTNAILAALRGVGIIASS
ncbi:MAG: hypothetical protein KDD83_16655 [Caldilineaceae bacterium]|nr:hypothetical protein [Caldilineaceae bacterium]